MREMKKRNDYKKKNEVNLNNKKGKGRWKSNVNSYMGKGRLVSKRSV